MQHLKSLAWLGLVYGIGKTENLGTEFVGDELIGIEFFGNESAKMNNLGLNRLDWNKVWNQSNFHKCI